MQTTNLKLPFFSARGYNLTITQPNGKPFCNVKLTKEEAEIIRMLIYPPSSRTRYTTRPYNYNTSFHLVDAQGNTVYYTYYSKKLDKLVRRPKTVKLRINKEIWMQYRVYNRKAGLHRTDCSIVREFYREFEAIQGVKPTQETLRYFIETLVKLNPATTYLRLEDFPNRPQKSFIDQRQIVILPTIRKTPTYRGLDP